jgi:hypothetical protein
VVIHSGHFEIRCFLQESLGIRLAEDSAGRTWMAGKTVKLRPWTKEDVRALKTLAREKTKTTVIARKLKRSVGATHQKAMRLGVTLGRGRTRKPT